MNTQTLTVLGMLLVVVALPTFLYLSRTQQTFQQSAHTPSPSATAVCQGTTVVVSSSYTIASVPTNVTCSVTATDSQQFLNDSFSMKQGSSPHTKSVDTKESTISPGVVTFKTKCTDGFSQTNQAGYSLKTPCVTPTPTPSLTPVPSITPTPTACISPAAPQNVKVSCPNC